MNTLQKNQGDYKRMQNALMNDPTLRMAPHYQTASELMRILHSGGKKWCLTALCALLETAKKSGVLERVFAIYRQFTSTGLLDSLLDPNIKPRENKTIDLRSLDNDE